MQHSTMSFRCDVPPSKAALAQDGFVILPHDQETARWADAARAAAEIRLDEAEMQKLWLRCQGTWFAGVDVLPNDRNGAVGGVPLRGAALDLVEDLGWMPVRWHMGQVSVAFPGYPKPAEGETPAAARYRRNRDAAHVDGLLPLGSARRRYLKEPHAFVLGLPLNEAPADAAPLVAWQGSHRIIGQALRQVLSSHPPDRWPEIDLTDAYQSARRTCFEQCRRILLPAQPGMATLLHRHTLHGISPWLSDGGTSRMIAYFRPMLSDMSQWVDA